MLALLHTARFRLIFLLGFLVFSGCATVPETGRKQINLISPQQEMQLGLTEFQKMKKEMPVDRDPERNTLLQRVGQRIAAVARMPGAQWEFVLFDHKEPNAFALPGGKVGVFNSLLPITQNEAGLATVIGHEVAHAVAHHGAERMSEALLIQTGGILLGGAAGSDKELRDTMMVAYGLGTSLGRALPHSRGQESEADYIGLLYMARAGYDPNEAIALWERFAVYNQKRGGGTPWFLRTHPMDKERIEKLKQWLPRAEKEYQKSKFR